GGGGGGRWGAGPPAGAAGGQGRGAEWGSARRQPRLLVALEGGAAFGRADGEPARELVLAVGVRDQRWLLDAALVLHVRASRTELATLRRVDEVGRPAGDRREACVRLVAAFGGPGPPRLRLGHPPPPEPHLPPG